MSTLFASAFLFGLAFNAAPGAVAAESLRRGLHGGFRPAFAVQAAWGAAQGALRLVHPAG